MRVAMGMRVRMSVHLDMQLDRFEHQDMRFRLSGGMRATRAAGLAAGTERFVHDLLDGAGATTALRTTAQTSIHLARSPRRARAAAGGADIVVGQDVAGTNNHRDVRSQVWTSFG